VEHVVKTLQVSERHACRVLGQPRTTQRKPLKTADDEAALTADIIELARQYGRYGYRRITALLRDAGWVVNKKRIARIWRNEGLKVPQRQPKRSRLWLNDGSCIRLCGRSGRTTCGLMTLWKIAPMTAGRSEC
jgi:transposase InsO family protein